MHEALLARPSLYSSLRPVPCLSGWRAGCLAGREILPWAALPCRTQNASRINKDVLFLPCLLACLLRGWGVRADGRPAGRDDRVTQHTLLAPCFIYASEVSSSSPSSSVFDAAAAAAERAWWLRLLLVFTRRDAAGSYLGFDHPSINTGAQKKSVGNFFDWNRQFAVNSGHFDGRSSDETPFRID